MGASSDGIAVIGDYTDAVLATRVGVLLDLIPDPDTTSTSGAQAGGGNLDEMSAIAAAHLRVELEALAASGADLGFAAAGKYTMVAADDTANQVDIVTGLANITLANGAVQIRRAGADVTADAVISEPVAGTIRVADGAATYDCTAGDVVWWIANP